jgi:secreted trypsin-like serine protease
MSSSVGWGAIGFDENGTSVYTDVPQATTINYVTTEDCTSPPSPWQVGWITDSMMCAIDEVSSDCYGDSGGPLVLENVDGDGPAQPVVQVGIVSWGIYGTRFRFQLYLHLNFCYVCRNSHLHTVSLFVGCLNATAPSVYTRISDVADWIKHTVCERSGELCDGNKSGNVRTGKGGKPTPTGSIGANGKSIREFLFSRIVQWHDKFCIILISLIIIIYFSKSFRPQSHQARSQLVSAFIFACHQSSSE